MALALALAVSGTDLLHFILEQLNLLQTAKHGRQYSSQTTVLGFIWQMTSNGLYRKLRKVLILPSATRFCHLSSAISIEHENIYFDYLDRRTLKLSSHEKIVTLLIDEVYSIQHRGWNIQGVPQKSLFFNF